MGTERVVIARARMIDLQVIDVVLAGLLTIGAVVDASSHSHRGLHPLAVVSLVALTGSVAGRRPNPWLTTVIGVSAFMVFQDASGYAGGGEFEVATLALNFYLLGRRTSGPDHVLRSTVVFAYWLVGATVITYDQAGGSVGAVLGSWALVGGLPFAVGRSLQTRRVLTLALEASTAQLADAQEDRARRAAAEERNRMARELHDVIAHHVSVMVLQTSGARLVAAGEPQRARAALRVVESAGRDALVELRRIVGVLHRGSEVLAGSAVAPGLLQLDVLADRARAAGLPVEVQVDGRLQALSPGLDLVAYRVVQEALTNAIKHAGAARARVSVCVGARWLELEVSDDGHQPPRRRDADREPGHGLIGMSERVRLYGGDLHTGRRADSDGFEVRARIPLDGAVSSDVVSPAADASRPTLAAGGGWRSRRLDPVLAGVSLVVLEIAVLIGGHRRGPLVLNLLAVAVIALAAGWRRRSPLGFVLVVGLLAAVANALLTTFDHSPLLAAYFLLVPAYTAAAWQARGRAVLALAFLLGGTAVSVLIARHQPVGTLAGAAFTISAAWAAGRAIRAHRTLASELQRTAARLAAEREDRARLAVAGERSRIASELHAVVARSVAAMVVQAQGAGRMISRDPARADAAMAAIEATGRQTLAEMRRILGALRHSDVRGELDPQPGVAQVYSLIQRARERGQPVKLRVDGAPGVLAAAVDLGVYRIVENALESARRRPASPVSVTLQFREEDLELRLTAGCPQPSAWPTEVMRERITLCDGALEQAPLDQDGWQLVARMPRGWQGALP